MSKRRPDEEALFRFSIISPLLNERPLHGGLKQRFVELAAKFYEHPTQGWRQYSPRTLEDWYYAYRRHGIGGLSKQRRRDYGRSRTISPEIEELIVTMKIENPKRTAYGILKELRLAGKIAPGEVSRSAVYRLLRHRHNEIRLHRVPRDAREIRKFSFATSNECWQSDVCYGPHLRVEGSVKKKTVFIYGFMDDASRVVPHLGAALAENQAHFLEFWKTAMLKKGIPRRLYVDNASYFRSGLVRVIGARLGIRIIYCTPYSPHTKGKIERFWRRLRDQCLSHLDREQNYSLEELNRLLTTWIEEEYHRTTHTSLGKTPIEAWMEKSHDIRYPDGQTIGKDFMPEESRKVRRDGTVSLGGNLYEVDAALEGLWVTLRHDPFRKEKIYVYLDEEPLGEAYVVDEIENRKTPRRRLADRKDTTSSGIDYLSLLERRKKNDV
jgi:transposase InsO family protein